jgi:hypothetical protein
VRERCARAAHYGFREEQVPFVRILAFWQDLCQRLCATNVASAFQIFFISWVSSPLSTSVLQNLQLCSTSDSLRMNASQIYLLASQVLQQYAFDLGDGVWMLMHM